MVQFLKQQIDLKGVSMQTTNSELNSAILKLIKTVGILSYKIINVLTVMAKRGFVGEKI